MPTPDWEEWLRRQDFDVEDTVTVDAYRRMLEEELDIHGGSLDVASDIYAEKFDVFEPRGILYLLMFLRCICLVVHRLVVLVEVLSSHH